MTEDALYDGARQETRAAVARLTANLGDPASQHHDPLARIRAARRLEWAAADSVRSGAWQARCDGASWAQVGDALGYKPDPAHGVVVAEQAFRHLASDLGGGRLSFGFTCGSCGQVVLDYGPETGPRDAEQGHAEGCERFAATVAAWDAQLEDSSEGDEGDGRDE